MIIDKALSKIFGTKHDRDVKALQPRVAAIADLEPEHDSPLGRRPPGAPVRDQNPGPARRSATLPEEMEERRRRVKEVLDAELVEVFAIVREAGKRTLEQRHYDVQMMGGIVLHEGKIAEMRTGEGKTLVATLPVTLNALTGRGVHVVTVNDYLAKRDAEWMGQIYTVPRPLRRLHPARHGRRRRGARRTAATSRTGRTTSSASTTCATT